MNVKVNRWLDLLDRVGWTFLQAFAGTMLVLGFNDWAGRCSRRPLR
jgi:hypothetical protein